MLGDGGGPPTTRASPQAAPEANFAVKMRMGEAKEAVYALEPI